MNKFENEIKKLDEKLKNIYLKKEPLDFVLNIISFGWFSSSLIQEKINQEKIEFLSYKIYEKEIKQRYKFGLFSFLEIYEKKENKMKNNLEPKSLQQLANKVQKITTGIDLEKANPYQKLTRNLKLVQLEINKEKIDSIHKQIFDDISLTNEINSFDFNQPSTSGYKPSSPKI